MLFPFEQEPENRIPEGAEPGHWGFSPCSTWAVPGVMPEQEQPLFLTTSLYTCGTEKPAKPRERNPALPGVLGKPEVQNQIPQPRAHVQRNLVI